MAAPAWAPCSGEDRRDLTLAAAVAGTGVCSHESKGWRARIDLLERAERISWGSGGVGRADCNSDNPKLI